MPNPFEKKKPPTDPKTTAPVDPKAPAPADPKAPAPADPKAPAPADPKAPAPANPKAPTKSKGNSAPMTPGQGEPDVKPHEEPGVKAEPEDAKVALPKEADTSEAKPYPTGLPSVAVMTKAEAEGADKDPMNNPHIQRLATLVQGLAKIVQEHHAKLGAMPIPGQAAPSGQTAGQGKPAMPGAKGQGLPGARPPMPQGQGMRPGLPGVAGQGVRPGVTPPPAPGSSLSLEQITSMMGIIEAANSSRIPRQAASMLISQGFGIDLKAAQSMVSPDALAAGTPDALAAGAALGKPGAGDISALNPEEEEMEGVEEEEEGEEEDEDDHTGFAYGAHQRRDAQETVKMDRVIEELEELHAQVVAKLDAMEFARNVYRDEHFDA